MTCCSLTQMLLAYKVGGISEGPLIVLGKMILVQKINIILKGGIFNAME